MIIVYYYTLFEIATYGLTLQLEYIDFLMGSADVWYLHTR